MKIVLSSTNKAKTMAIQKVFSQVAENIEVVTIDVDSGVSKTPTTDDEGICGAMNRISNAKKKVSDGDVYVGLEGIITTNNYGTFICGWAVVDLVKENKIGIGCSAKVKLSETIAKKVQSFNELSELVKEIYSSELLQKMDEIGTNGVVTNGMYTRTKEFEDALTCALGFVLNKNN